MARFLRIGDRFDVAPALAELAGRPEYWVRLNPDACRYVPLLGAGNARLLESELPQVWRLIDAVLAVAARAHGDRGRLSHARAGLMPPGCGLPPHCDGIDGARQRRYQLALRSEPGVELVVDGELKCPEAGEAWQIDAGLVHSIANHSAEDRIVILFDTQVAD